ncbi:hypothetical protein M0220_00530 [Halomonas qinghailakensis]|uniref:Uncharacterized protein n=2 Tax=Halomonas TaxID=2745 RepID=A0AA46TR42_9GAMM|nr:MULTISPECIES: hypothetical protein [Halomonas]UYO74683.1 hypothetical protein M0220_00530 [Halomonas sp. ZZQ-149]UYV20383.1 hypothetical protein K1Y77_06975 [Halomonas qaidamensis]
MQSKYKIRLLRANLFAAALVLALWTHTAQPMAALVLWLSVGWLFVTALLLDFSHRRSKGPPWQLITGVLLLGLIAAAPERHSLLIWAWPAMFMLPQKRWVVVFNALAALMSWLLIIPLFSLPEGLLLLTALITLSILSSAKACQLIDMNGSIRSRLRLIPGLNLWPSGQLLRDLNREQTRSEREAIYAELLIIQVKRHQLWAAAQKLCNLTYNFENVYRLNSQTLATLMLSHNSQEAAHRRKLLCAGLPEKQLSYHLPLIDLELSGLTVETLANFPPHPREDSND